MVEEHTFGLSLNFPKLQFPHFKNGGGTCLLELLHQLNKIVFNVRTVVSGQQMVIFSLDNAFIHTLQQIENLSILCSRGSSKFYVIFFTFSTVNLKNLVGEQIGVMMLAMT